MMEKETNMEMSNEEPMEMPEQPEGIDGIIAMVDQYIAKPETVTPETLMDLRAQLEDLKTILEPDSAEPEAPMAGNVGGLAGMMRGA